MIRDVTWKLRNQVKFEGITPKLDEIMLKVFSFVAKFRKVLDYPMWPSNNRAQSVWSKLDREPIKINVNVACNLESPSIEVVPRDWRGEVLFVCLKKVNPTFPLHAEVEAII